MRPFRPPLCPPAPTALVLGASAAYTIKLLHPTALARLTPLLPDMALAPTHCHAIDDHAHFGGLVALGATIVTVTGLERTSNHPVEPQTCRFTVIM